MKMILLSLESTTKIIKPLGTIVGKMKLYMALCACVHYKPQIELSTKVF